MIRRMRPLPCGWTVVPGSGSLIGLLEGMSAHWVVSVHLRTQNIYRSIPQQLPVFICSHYSLVSQIGAFCFQYGQCCDRRRDGGASAAPLSKCWVVPRNIRYLFCHEKLVFNYNRARMLDQIYYSRRVKTMFSQSTTPTLTNWFGIPEANDIDTVICAFGVNGTYLSSS